MTRSKKVQTPDDIAQKILGRLSDACGEIGYEAERHPEWQDGAVQRKLNAAKAAGVKDLGGWYAEEIYNDQNTLCDLIGDWAYEEAGNDDTLHDAILDALSARGWPALKRAVEDLRREV